MSKDHDILTVEEVARYLKVTERHVPYGTDSRDRYFVRVVEGKVDAFGEWGDFGSTQDPATTINQNIKIQSVN